MITKNEEKVNLAIDIAIKLSVIAMVVFIAYLIAKPFLAITAWGIIIAIAISPIINMLQKYIKSRKVVIIAFTLTIVALLIVPAFMLSSTAISSSEDLVQLVQTEGIIVPPPSEDVKEWPLVGEKVYAFWDAASQNIKATLEPYTENIIGLLSSVFSAIGSGLSLILMFIASLIISAIFLLNADAASHFYKRLLKRLIGQRADEWAKLSALTVRSVVNGVIGVAVIQAVFAFVGLALMDIPFAIIWALVIMFLTIVQLPALLIIAPIIIYVFSQGSGTSEVIFTIYMIIVGASDGVLKPLLMGRGVDTPMLVILIGAIGGMLLMGMIGLFIGAVLFALTYELFKLWINEEENKID